MSDVYIPISNSKMDSYMRNNVATVLICVGIVLFGVTHVTVASIQCYECDFWAANSTDMTCLHPEGVSSLWADSVEIVECEHACFVSNHSLGDPDSIWISRGCYQDEYCPDICMYDPVDDWESCTHCCDDDLCNDVLPEETFEDSTWCYDCGSYDDDCINPSRETTLRTTCDTMCEMNIYISQQTSVMRGCAISEDDCDDCDEKEDCTLCCKGSFCNDASPDAIARQSNFTHNCYSCYYSPDAFEVQDSRGCGEEFDPSGLGMELVQCSGVCKKVVSGSSVERSCVHDLRDCKPGCQLFGGPCTYCCTGDNCNGANRIGTSSQLLTFLLAVFVTWLRCF